MEAVVEGLELVVDRLVQQEVYVSLNVLWQNKDTHHRITTKLCLSTSILLFNSNK